MSEYQRTKKKDLITSGLKLYLRDGYQDTTIDDIVNDVGIAKGTFYLYFSSKNYYLCELYSWVFSQAYDELEVMFHKPLPAWQKLERFFEAFFHLLDENRDLVTMFHKISYSVDLVRLNYEVGKRLIDPLADTIDQGIREGTMESDNPWATAFLLKSMFEGALHTAIVMDLPFSFKYLEEQFIKTLKGALTSRRSPRMR